MIPRYTEKRIAEIFGDRNKTSEWDNTEAAVIEASEGLGEFPQGVHERIAAALAANPVDLEWWLGRDKIIHHDLNAYLEERLHHIVSSLQRYFHRKMTSFDTEESAFAIMLAQALEVILEAYEALDDVLEELARQHRHTAMIGRSHGQGGDGQSFGKRVLTWLREVREARLQLAHAAENLKYSKLSGAMGNYGGFSPEVEKEALRIRGLVPFYGATQIMPRVLYIPLASALCSLVCVIEKIGLDIRLGARGPNPIYQEPFAKTQKGSSAMPHKRNPINSEKLMGMGRMARGYLLMIVENIVTWEERAIEQSSVERVAWPDLFHATYHSLEVIIKVLRGLKVYPDNMMLELVESRGCFAASQAKELLKDMGGEVWQDAEEAYRIVQLAAFNVFTPSGRAKAIRGMEHKDFSFADAFLTNPEPLDSPYVTIKEVIAKGQLRMTDELAATQEQVERWNEILRGIFQVSAHRLEWEQVFLPSHLLKNEDILYREILGE